MLYIRTETREMAIHNVDGEKYFDAIMKMMLEERTVPSMGVAAPERKPEPIQKEAEVVPEKPVGEREEGYKGFMHITCSRCGRVKTFFAKERIKAFRCRDCDKETELIPEKMRKAYASCKCGTDIHYWTNSEEGAFDISCLNCGAPVTVSWNSKMKCFYTLKG